MIYDLLIPPSTNAVQIYPLKGVSPLDGRIPVLGHICRQVRAEVLRRFFNQEFCIFITNVYDRVYAASWVNDNIESKACHFPHKLELRGYAKVGTACTPEVIVSITTPKDDERTKIRVSEDRCSSCACKAGMHTEAFQMLEEQAGRIVVEGIDGERTLLRLELTLLITMLERDSGSRFPDRPLRDRCFWLWLLCKIVDTLASWYLAGVIALVSKRWFTAS